MTSEPHSPPPMLIDSKQAASMLGIAPRTLDKYRHLGAIPSLLIGTARRYRVAELMAWIDAGCPTDPDAGDRIRQGGSP